ncbi:MAG: DUF1624 domain-containing protein [Actinobacteria bacterium]|jgi:uncharacterized membrane protein YeiB|uniref:Unannotated protein n=1 Tax=freshwater metagenome TaxID=449393 RepID=A0A6J6ETX8_9ZZZZ|nr:DUF1624 domain-containing protein [Actinomycetota bacterium]
MHVDDRPLPPPTPGPVPDASDLDGSSRPARPSRQIGLDVARALAILGMLLAHFGGAATSGDEGWARDVTRFVDGRAMPLFVVLSGAGLSLLLARSTRPVREMTGRAAVLLVLGLALEYTTPVGVILQYYALFFLLALLVRRLRDRWLLVGAVAVVALAPVTRLFLAELLPHGFQHVGDHAADLGALGVLRRPDALLADLFVGGVYPAFPTFAFVLVGMWIGRRNLSSSRLHVGLVGAGLLMAVVGYGAGWSTDDQRAIPASLLAQYGDITELGRTADRYGLDLVEGVEYTAVASRMSEDELYDEQAAMSGMTGEELRSVIAQIAADEGFRDGVAPTWWEPLDAAGHSHMPAWMLGSTGFAIAVIGACLALAARMRRVVMPLAWAGQMALTLYVAHLVLLRWPLQNWPWELGPGEAVMWTAAGFAVAVAVCSLWRLRFAHGPLEAVLRLAGGGSLRRREAAV